MRGLAPWILLAGVVSAAPALQSEHVQVVSAQVVSQLQFFAQYAGAAYCFGNTHGSAEKVSCSTGGGNCSSIESGQTKIIQSFSETGDSSTSGFVAVDDTHELIVVALQGTAIAGNVLSVVTDMSVHRAKTDMCGSEHNKEDGCVIHDGFWRAAMDVRDLIVRHVTAAQKAHPTYKIVTTGHSLGGAVASLMGAQLRSYGFIVDIYTYGQPHIGAIDIARFIESQSPHLGSNYRVTHGVDVVPRLPLHAYGEWGHFYPEYYIPNDDAGVDGVWEVQRIERDQPGGNEAHASLWWMAWQAYKGVAAHRNYFGPIAACSPTRLP